MRSVLAGPLLVVIFYHYYMPNTYVHILNVLMFAFALLFESYIISFYLFNILLFKNVS